MPLRLKRERAGLRWQAREQMAYWVTVAERWPNGLRRTPGTRVDSKGSRGVKSAPLRNSVCDLRHSPQKPADQLVTGVSVPNRPSCSLTSPVVKYRTCGLAF